MHLLHSGNKDYTIQVASLTTATASSFAGMNNPMRVPRQLSMGGLMKNWLPLEHVPSLISKAKKLINVHAVSLPRPTWAERVGQGEVGWYTQRMKTAWLFVGWAMRFPQYRATFLI